MSGKPIRKTYKVIADYAPRDENHIGASEDQGDTQAPNKPQKPQKPGSKAPAPPAPVPVKPQANKPPPPVKVTAGQPAKGAPPPPARAAPPPPNKPAGPPPPRGPANAPQHVAPVATHAPAPHPPLQRAPKVAPVVPAAPVLTVAQKQQLLSAELVMSLPSETSGEAVTFLVDNDYFAVRQGDRLNLVSLPEQVVNPNHATLPSYNKMPCGIFENVYVEIQSDKIFKVSIPDMVVAEEQKLAFLSPLKSPAFVQQGQYIIIFDQKNLYSYDIQSGKLMFGSQFDNLPFIPEFGSLMCASRETLWFLGFQNQEYKSQALKLNVHNHSFQLMKLPIDISGASGYFVEDKFYLLGLQNPKYQKNIICIDPSTQKFNLIYEHNRSLVGQKASVAGSLMFVGSENYINILESQIVPFIIERQPVTIVRLAEQPLTVKKQVVEEHKELNLEDLLAGSAITAELAMEIDLPTEGPAVTLLHDNSFYVVRQGERLNLISIEKQEVESAFAELPTYSKMPCGLYNGAYVEILQDKVINVKVPSMDIEEHPSLTFLHPLETPSFMQINHFIVIFNVSQLYVYDIEKAQLKFSSQLEDLAFQPKFGSLICCNRENLYLVGHDEFDNADKIIIINVCNHSSEIVTLPLKVQNCNGYCISDKLYLAGVKNSEAPEYESSLICIDIKNKKIDVIYSHSTDLSDQKYSVGGPLLLISDVQNRTMIIDTPLAELIQEYNPVTILKVADQPLRNPQILEKELQEKIAAAQATANEEEKSKLLKEQEAAKRRAEEEALHQKELEEKERLEKEEQAKKDAEKQKEIEEEHERLNKELDDKRKAEQDEQRKKNEEQQRERDRQKQEEDDLNRKLREEQDETRRKALEEQLKATAVRNRQQLVDYERTQKENAERARLEREAIEAALARKKRGLATFDIVKKEKVADVAASQKFSDVMKYWAAKNKK